MKFIQIPYQIESAAKNMAIDYDMLVRNDLADSVIFRSYGWNEKAITFGYSQAYNEILTSYPQSNVLKIRRTTGGGIVEHFHDFTYALKLPSNHKNSKIKASTTYKELHQAVQSALHQNGIEAKLSPCLQSCPAKEDSPILNKQGPSACFQQSEPYDLVDPISGKKVAGAAMKRTKQGMLIQGSIIHPKLKDTDDCRSIESALISSFCLWLNSPPISEQKKPSATLKIWEKKFYSKAWNAKR